MATRKTDFIIKGIKEVTENLRLLGSEIGGNIGRKAMNKALNPMLSEARNQAPIETGFTKKAIAKKVKFYANTQHVLGMIGADTNFKTFRGKGEDGKNKYHQPSKILHLLEFGTVKTPGTRFLTKAYASTITVVQALFASEVETAIKRLHFKHTK